MLNLTNATEITKEELTLKIATASKELKTRISIQYFGDESKSKVKNKKKVLQKRNFVVVGLNGEYKKMIEARTKEEFIPRTMLGKIKVMNNIYKSEKTGKLLVKLYSYKSDFSETEYFHNSEKISFEKAKELNLFQPSFFTKKKTVGRGTVSKDKDFSIFTLGIDKIEGVKIGGVIYKII